MVKRLPTMWETQVQSLHQEDLLEKEMATHSNFVCYVVFIGLLFTRFWMINTPWQGGRQSAFIKHLTLWKYLKDYYPISLVKTAELDPSRNYLAGFYPHGNGVIGAFTNLCMESMGFFSVFPGICSHLMMLNMWFWFPFFRDYAMSMWLVSSDKEGALHILRRKGSGNLLSIIVGGVKEALNARPGAYKLVLWNHKGFIRLTLIHGYREEGSEAALVPIFSFGENDIYDQVENSPGSWLHWFQDRLLKTTRFSIPLFDGRGVFQYSFGLMPYRRPITTVDISSCSGPSLSSVLQWGSPSKCRRHHIPPKAHKLKYSIPKDQHLKFS
ncbi:hypothetical protein FD754_023443 [Muntiacus muntjak]|uniref:Acyltransferase n=1 Tax=Muntiacus muntjak TaxID=9888 RepID=A0A5N3UU37_MUNMU|nr:hypothetical protein FD754_023443 [Muntiacus muntjak]